MPTGLLLLLVLPFVLLFTYAIRDEVRKHRRTRGGHICRACGYDLTGNVSGVCPECGARVKAKSRTRSGLCRRCGYELCATPERCPECGTPVAGKGAAK